jgi:hypothetical protein
VTGVKERVNPMVTNELGPILDAIVVALAVLLVFVAGTATVRYRDLRFAFVAAALAALGAVGALGVIGLLSPGSIPGSDLGTTPALVLIGAEVLFYLSFVVSRNWTGAPPSK